MEWNGMLQKQLQQQATCSFFTAQQINHFLAFWTPPLSPPSNTHYPSLTLWPIQTACVENLFKNKQTKTRPLSHRNLFNKFLWIERRPQAEAAPYKTVEARSIRKTIFNLVSELLQRFLEHFRLHHGRRQHHRRHEDGLRRLPQTLQSRSADQAAPAKRQRSNPPLHIRPVVQGQCDQIWRKITTLAQR